MAQADGLGVVRDAQRARPRSKRGRQVRSGRDATGPASPGSFTTECARSARPDRLTMRCADLGAAGQAGHCGGRDREIDQLIIIRVRTQKSNPLLLGEAGVGQAAILDGWLGDAGTAPPPARSSVRFVPHRSVPGWNVCCATASDRPHHRRLCTATIGAVSGLGWSNFRSVSRTAAPPRNPRRSPRSARTVPGGRRARRRLRDGASSARTWDAGRR